MYSFRRYSISVAQRVSQLLSEDAARIPAVDPRKTVAARKSKQHPIVDGPYLNQHFQNRSKIQMVSKASVSQASGVTKFFNEAKIEQEWSVFDYENIREANLSEVLLLGRCNVGKSSLINALFSNNGQSVRTYAKARQSAGYTLCLNFYNVGGKLRVVDSPGYGEKGKAWQGDLVIRYLQERKELRNCYLLVDSKIGLNQYDEAILSSLVEYGVPFDVVFNKIDKVPQEKRVRHFGSLIDRTPALANLNIKPRFYFVNSVANAKTGLRHRSGITELRLAMLNACGLDVKGLRPSRKKTAESDLAEKRRLKNVKMIINTPKMPVY